MADTSSSALVDRLARLNAALAAQQVEPLVLHPSLDCSSAENIISCVEALLGQRHKEAAFRDEAFATIQRLQAEAEALEVRKSRAAEIADRAEREVATAKIRQQSLAQEAQRQLANLQTQADHVAKANSQLQCRQTQLQHQVARKEKEKERLAEKIARQLLQDRERRGSVGSLPLNEVPDDLQRSFSKSRRADQSLDTTMSDAYEPNLADYRANISTVQTALHAFNSELARLACQYANNALDPPMREQYSAPYHYSQGPIDEYFQATLQTLRAALEATSKSSQSHTSQESAADDDPMD